MPSVVASSDAYVKALLHAYKYPTQPVMGILAGKRIRDSTDCYVIDAFPLFHALPMGAPHPMLEVVYAHSQAAARTAGLTILGVYIANERLGDRGINKELTRPVLEFLSARLGLGGGGGARDRLLVWFLDNEAMCSPPRALAVTSFYYEPGLFESSARGPASSSSSSSSSQVPRPAACLEAGVAAPLTSLTFGEWNSDTLAPEATVPVEAAVEAISNALDVFAHFRVVDAEDHLEDPDANYLEQPLRTLTARK